MHERLVMEHYLLDSLDMVTRNVTTPSRQRLRSDVEEHINDWEPNALEILRDFAALCCIDEMCYYGSHCQTHRTHSTDYNPSYDEYTRESVLERATEIFGKGIWDGGYGGDRWLGIAKAAHTPLLAPRAAINHMVNLCHNNDTIFSREYMGLSVRLQSSQDNRFVAMRRMLKKLTIEGPLWQKYIEYTLPPIKIGAEVFSLLERAKVLELVDIDLSLLAPERSPLPPTLDWGTKEFPQLVAKHDDDNNEDDEDDEDGEDE